MPKKKNNKTKVPTESLKNVEEQSIVTENVADLEPAVKEPAAEEPAVKEPAAEESVAVVEESVAVVKSDNLCSLKTLINVLGKWSNKEIRQRNVETLLKEGPEVDENLDNIEKAVEVLKLWIKEGGSAFKSHDHFLDMERYTLIGESKNLSEEKKVEVLKTLTELVINVSNRRISDEERDTVLNNL